LKIIAAACTDGTFVIFIYLTPSPLSAHQRGLPEGGEKNAKEAWTILSFLTRLSSVSSGHSQAPLKPYALNSLSSWLRSSERGGLDGL
jgi:hypothetical protein